MSVQRIGNLQLELLLPGGAEGDAESEHDRQQGAAAVLRTGNVTPVGGRSTLLTLIWISACARYITPAAKTKIRPALSLTFQDIAVKPAPIAKNPPITITPPMKPADSTIEANRESV